MVFAARNWGKNDRQPRLRGGNMLVDSVIWPCVFPWRHLMINTFSGWRSIKLTVALLSLVRRRRECAFYGVAKCTQSQSSPDPWKWSTKQRKLRENCPFPLFSTCLLTGKLITAAAAAAPVKRDYYCPLFIDSPNCLQKKKESLDYSLKSINQSINHNQSINRIINPPIKPSSQSTNQSIDQSTDWTMSDEGRTNYSAYNKLYYVILQTKIKRHKITCILDWQYENNFSMKSYMVKSEPWHI